MADCKRVDIPQDIIISKGDFKCDNDFLPSPDSNGVVPDLIGIRPSFNYYNDGSPSSCGMSDLWTLMADPFLFRNVSWNDEYMSWQSDLFTIPDSAVRPSGARLTRYYSQACDGLCFQFAPTPQSHPTCVTDEYPEWNPYFGVSHNHGFQGGTVQFFFNIYKVYCCVLDEDGDVTDYNYFYYFSMMMRSSANGLQVVNYGSINFCSPLLISAGQYPGIRS